MKKKSLLAILFGIIALLLIACGGEDNNGSSGQADEVETVGEDIEDATELTLWTFAPNHVAFYVDAAERWNEDHSDRPIRLKAETYPADQMHNNLLLALQSGKGAPDIADIEAWSFTNFLKGDIQLEPMNEYVEPVLENFVEARFALYAKDGNYYGMPTHVGASVMYYNTEIMNEAGVDIDSIGTWDDFLVAGEKVVANTEAVMMSLFPGESLSHHQLVSQQGSDYYDENDDISLNHQESVDALQLLADMQDKGIAEIAPGNHPYSEEFYSFLNGGGVAAVNMPAWYMSQIMINMPDLKGKVVVRPMPAFKEGGDRSAAIGGTGTAVTNQSEHLDLAKEFLAYAKLTKESNIKLWTILGFDPPRHDVWDHPDVLEDNDYFQFFGDDIFKTIQELQNEINPILASPYAKDVQTELNTNTLNNVLRDGSQSPKEALDQAQETLETQITD